ncbi:hypothetical protein QQZ08_011747 [Neonectria magnoliae]|uniref:Uncharacterized protein n=1 Tax=Neonectria magnoliae TaxID=2732573 RepID=A0ABR1H978_9HYPO
MNFYTGLSMLVLALGARADDAWTNPDVGDTHVDIGDKKISYGYAPPCENKIEYPTGVIQDGEMLGASLIISIEGSFNDPGSVTEMVWLRLLKQ